MFADEGFNVIVDRVSLFDSDYDLWVSTLSSYALFAVGITADPGILDQREINRGDRVIGGTRAQHQTVHNNYLYNLIIDTTNITPTEAANKIIQHLKH